MRPGTSIAIALALVGCKTTEQQVRDVQPPRVVTKVVEKTIDLPKWATEPVPNKAPSDKSVEAVVKANNARAGTLDYVNCRSRLIEKVQAGQKVDPKECRR